MYIVVRVVMCETQTIATRLQRLENSEKAGIDMVLAVLLASADPICVRQTSFYT